MSRRQPQPQAEDRPLTKGHVHVPKATGLKTSDGGIGLLQSVACYPLNELPK